MQYGSNRLICGRLRIRHGLLQLGLSSLAVEKYCPAMGHMRSVP